ncbi:hypothetical protein I5449_07135 [Citrobacter sp. FDAARGOS_156]|uniref:hypothetical protein n=1 Tax=Citrobacter sp. FDAARGOS_156 TaxID=1702170 RepID=UPI0018FF1D27|nr:hypothetical protein [Citrobacter sp. FDAARGOS_156]MBJ9111154.1 hypothetical protein [Citrobacter sp. FDAARGOS_156]
MQATQVLPEMPGIFREERMIKNIRNCCRSRGLLLRSVDAVYHWIGLSSLAILLFKVVVLNDIPAPVLRDPH